MAVFFAALIGGFALLAAARNPSRAPRHGRARPDPRRRFGGRELVESLAADRTPVLTDVSAVGSAVGGAPVLPILAGLIAIVCALMRRWLIAGFAAFVLTVESATYRVSSLVVPRERPSVHRLEDLPADASYPSGHTAASIAVYAGLVLLLTSRITDRRRGSPRGRSPCCCPSSSPCRACTAGCTIRSTWPAGSLIGIGAIMWSSSPVARRARRGRHAAAARARQGRARGMSVARPDRNGEVVRPGALERASRERRRQVSSMSTRRRARPQGGGPGRALAPAAVRVARARRPAARGVVYGIIGVLAIKLAFGDGGKTTNQQGALQTIARQPFGKVLLVLLALGLAGYALWRLVRAAIGHGPESERGRREGAHHRPGRAASPTSRSA